MISYHEHSSPLFVFNLLQKLTYMKKSSYYMLCRYFITQIEQQ